jgi:hypothetical protein
LHRYLAEFDLRYNTRTALGYDDYQRAELAAKGIVRKRLTYRRPHKHGHLLQVLTNSINRFKRIGP